MAANKSKNEHDDSTAVAKKAPAGNEQNEAGFYCDVCDCIVKDSLNYLDHINGKRHNKNLGISLKKFTDCTLEEVKQMLELKRRQRDEKESGFVYKEVSEEEIRQRKRDKKKRQKARKSGLLTDEQEQEDEEEEVDEEDEGENHAGLERASGKTNEAEDEMARIMGFASFSSSRR